MGRFSELGSEEFDEISAVFHLEQAAELSVREAVFSLAKIYLDLPRDFLPKYHPTVKMTYFNTLHLSSPWITGCHRSIE